MTGIGLASANGGGEVKGRDRSLRSERKEIFRCNERTIARQTEGGWEGGRMGWREEKRKDGRSDHHFNWPSLSALNSTALLKLHLRGEWILSMQIDAMLSSPRASAAPFLAHSFELDDSTTGSRRRRGRRDADERLIREISGRGIICLRLKNGAARRKLYGAGDMTDRGFVAASFN